MPPPACQPNSVVLTLRSPQALDDFDACVCTSQARRGDTAGTLPRARRMRSRDAWIGVSLTFSLRSSNDSVWRSMDDFDAETAGPSQPDLPADEADGIGHPRPRQSDVALDPRQAGADAEALSGGGCRRQQASGARGTQFQPSRRGDGSHVGPIGRAARKLQRGRGGRREEPLQSTGGGARSTLRKC